MSIPDFQSIMLPLLEFSDGKEWRNAEAVDYLAEKFGLSDEDRNAMNPSGYQTTFYNRVAWAKFYLAKAGLLEPTHKSRFTISDAGKGVLADPPQRITVKFLKQFPEFLQFKKMSDTSSESGQSDAEIPSPIEEALTPDEAIRGMHAQLEQELAEQLLSKIYSKDAAFFENVVVRLLFAMKYGGSFADIKKALVGGAGDGGVDGVIDQDILGLDRIYVQAKRYGEKNTVGPGAIRDFFGSLDRFKASKGLFVTTSTYTPTARDTAGMLSKRIVLIDGAQLARLMIRHNVGCRVEETLYIKKIDEEFFE